MFADMRTGSNYLEANLNAMPGVTCHGEVFNPHFVGKKDQTEMLGISLAARDRDPLALLKRLTQTTEGLSGFRFFHDHDPRVLAAVLADAGCAKIILTRNPAESYVSWKIAQATGQWKLTNAAKLKTARVRFDAAEFEAHLAALQAFQLEVLHRLQMTGQTAFYLDYEDISDVDVLNGLATFLGVATALAAPDAKLKKQNPEEIAEKVVNPEEMVAALGRIDRFNLGRTPNFEPRRGPAIPAILASGGAPLLFLPMRGGPEAAVTAWLGAFGGLGVTGAFTQKDLRQWKRANAGHRSFTVLRHPVARAHEVFCRQVLTGALADLRTVLARQMKVALPAPERVSGQSLTEHRAAFLGFLKCVKLGLSGQSNLRVDPHWASQSASLQGFAQFQTPDMVLREDQVEAGLAFLAAAVGLAMPGYSPEAVEAPFPLADVWDDEIEAAARDAYQRDYTAFGFSRWQ